ncbi:hypothetical protein Q5H91_00545 [Sphingomonas sp. KR1UV-12]|uniref:Uncharacterized protein n=1 Tax=Sphingomonas aurea TaxID=3063994 RepID=A0ABT9EFE9_9SPHN|nr:hypothetical protein [Sphingomonas sp. KR1UV-12]MDP1025689.1 hypothetical protein [Sphingomonas sp. KR1UV-12]
MNSVRLWAAVGAAAMMGMASTPASAQFFLQHHDYAGAPVQGDEPGIMQTLPGATPEERRAGLVWTMRSALNVAALQCQFEPSLLTVGNYNAALLDHKDELNSAWDTLNKYFLRNAKTKKEGLAALDQYGTRTYSSFATVASQYGFCRAAGSIGRDALFAPRGTLGDVAVARMRELRNSLVPYGEQRFSRYINATPVALPRLDPICWSKKGEWVVKKCGPIAWGPSATQMASSR